MLYTDLTMTAQQAKIINNFSVKVATTNGTGSQSANNIFFKSLVRMGIHTSSKNLFPSNIQGLPTWFVIRACPKEYNTMRQTAEVWVLVNRGSLEKDLKEIKKGTVVLYDSPGLEVPQTVEGAIYYPLPFSKLSRENFDKPRLRTLLTNVVYVGCLAALFHIDKKIIYEVIHDTFSEKPKVIDVNLKAIELGYDYVQKNIQKKDPYSYKPDTKTLGKMVIEGNQASALGCVMGGASVVAWYPITPASSLSENIEKFSDTFRKDPKTGKRNIAIIQAEDEIAAIGMAIGAGWAGARAMTGTSGPGISLMNEFIGLAYYAEVPVVICDVQRVGPSTGLPTRTQQGDIRLCAFASHGDTRHICLYPGTIEEAYEITALSFDIAERLQTPVFVLTDLELGMNLWTATPLKYWEKPYDRGKVLSKEDLDKMKSFSRYLDSDGDGICYRTFPGTPNPHAAYFTRGTGHNEHSAYTEDNEDYHRIMMRLKKKIDLSPKYLPKPIIEENKKAKIGIISIGTSHHAVVEARDELSSKHGIQTRYLRIRAFPFHEEVLTFIHQCEWVMVVEQNRDEQLTGILRNDFTEVVSKIHACAYSDGLPLRPSIVTDKILEVNSRAN
ncbi:MAG: 2-oxoacid:acceptor oxidoreductase subunit alpha [Deltaproteobacteria bacterium]|nr:2-oxoacid:acceptor oxidoreductase subunit alpha [Deltaproteobacteria bacterium]